MAKILVVQTERFITQQTTEIAATHTGKLGKHLSVLAHGFIDLNLCNKNVYAVLESKSCKRFTCTAPVTGWAWTFTTSAITELCNEIAN